ncbi:hypothetical protein [Pseudomonas sp.]|uniref:hypothetical protein n=1 Tax=Pseudomonas sp. TaxID=306 RepID=UPI00290BD9DA|nr:hypothetical protein [Pseudomonas sp.]MDU4254534.1 hypothetical protein [Pseudomonas sp.]
MSALTVQMDKIQGYGSAVGSAVRESQKLIKDNEFLLSADNGKTAKYVFFAAAALGVVAGIAAVPAAPVIAAVAVGVSTGVGVIGSALERIATEREQIRREHSQFISHARSFMTELQVAYSEVKHAIQEENRNGFTTSSDYVQYQTQREEQKQAQQLAASADQQVTRNESVPETRQSSGPSLG